VADLLQGPGAARQEAPSYEPPIARQVGETPEFTTHTAQAAAEGVVLTDGDYLDFFGEKFRLADRVGLMPMIHFGFASNQGLDSDDMEGLAAMYKLIRSVIHRPALVDDEGNRLRDANGKILRDESEWERFQQVAEDELAEGEDVMGFVNKAMEIMSARPRKPRSVSSGSSRPISETSKPVSSSPATRPMPDGLVPVSALGR
jgi:hypothetical protein